MSSEDALGLDMGRGTSRHEGKRCRDVRSGHGRVSIFTHLSENICFTTYRRGSFLRTVPWTSAPNRTGDRRLYLCVNRRKFFLDLGGKPQNPRSGKTP